jgi:threonine dehydratase
VGEQVRVPTYDEVAAARELIAGRVRRTPVVEVEVPTPSGARSVVLKLELLQHSGSFKPRGAFHSVLSGQERPDVLVAASGGNHGLAVAHVGHALGMAARIFVPRSAPAVKVAGIRALGAEVDQVGDTYAEAMAASTEEAGRPGVMALHAYDSWGTVTGQGTLGLEIAEQVVDADTVVVAVGGGGLMAGVATALSGAAPGCRVVAVEPRRCPTLSTALQQGAPLAVEVGGVAADSLGASRLGDIASHVARERGVTSVLVDDPAIIAAQRWLWRAARIAAEPGGATALAALLSGAWVPAEGERVCVVVCGGNADPAGLS